MGLLDASRPFLARQRGDFSKQEFYTNSFLLSI